MTKADYKNELQKEFGYFMKTDEIARYMRRDRKSIGVLLQNIPHMGEKPKLYATADIADMLFNLQTY